MTNYEIDKLMALVLGMTDEEKKRTLDILTNWDKIAADVENEKMLDIAVTHLKKYGVDTSDYKNVSIALLSLIKAAVTDINDIPYTIPGGTGIQRALVEDVLEKRFNGLIKGDK